MKTKIKLTRSAEWVKEKRLSTGNNVPGCVYVEVEISGLDLDSRALLLCLGQGSFNSQYDGLTHGSDYLPSPYRYGMVPFELDGDWNVAKVNESIRNAIIKLDAQRADIQEKQRTAKEKANQLQIDSMRSKLKKSEGDNTVLSEFLYLFSVDELKRVAEENGVNRSEIENASTMWLFSNRD